MATERTELTCDFCGPADEVPPVMFGNHANICVRCVGNFMKLIKLYDMAVFERLVDEARAFEAPKPPEVA